MPWWSDRGNLPAIRSRSVSPLTLTAQPSVSGSRRCGSALQLAGPTPRPARPRAPRAPAGARGRSPRHARYIDRLLVRYAAERDPADRDALVREFLPLAQKLAHRYVRSSSPPEDLFQVASLGLVKAVDRFDPGRGSSFGAFAIPTILGELRRYFRDATWAVHVPRGAQERAAAIDAASERLTNAGGRPPTVEQIATELDLSPEEVLDGLIARRAYDAEPLEHPDAFDDGDPGLSLLDVVGTEDHRYTLIEEQAVVVPVLRELSERERRVLYLRFVLEMSQREIAEQIGVSQMQVSRILSATITKIRRLGGVQEAA